MRPEVRRHGISMLNRWCADEKWTSQRPPLLKRVGVAEGDHMVLHTLPLDKQAVFGGVFNRAFKRHAVASLRGTEQRSRLRNRGFEIGSAGGIDGDGGNFSDHHTVMAQTGRKDNP